MARVLGFSAPTAVHRCVWPTPGLGRRLEGLAPLQAVELVARERAGLRAHHHTIGMHEAILAVSADHPTEVSVKPIPAVRRGVGLAVLAIFLPAVVHIAQRGHGERLLQ